MADSLAGLFGNAPAPKIVGLDPTTQKLMNDQAQRAIGENPADIAGQLNAGTDKAAASLAGPSSDQQAAGTGSDPSVLRAIRNQYSQMNNQDLSQLKQSNANQAQFMHGQRMQDAARSMLAQQQVQTQNYAALSQAYQANEMARAQTISSLINLGSTAYTMNKTGTNRKNASLKSEFNAGQINENPMDGAMNDSGQMNG